MTVQIYMVGPKSHFSVLAEEDKEKAAEAMRKDMVAKTLADNIIGVKMMATGVEDTLVKTYLEQNDPRNSDFGLAYVMIGTTMFSFVLPEDMTPDEGITVETVQSFNEAMMKANQSAMDRYMPIQNNMDEVNAKMKFEGGLLQSFINKVRSIYRTPHASNTTKH